MVPILFVGSLVFIICAIIISCYNKLNTTKNQIGNARSSLDALFIKRSELMPNLVTVVKQYMLFEKDVLEKITSMRIPAGNGNNNYLQDDDGNKLLKQLMVQVENYPELKANSQFTNLQYSWNEVEEQLSAGRRFFSSAVTEYNDAVTTFPGNFIGGMFGYKTFEWEQASAVQRENVEAAKMF